MRTYDSRKKKSSSIPVVQTETLKTHQPAEMNPLTIQAKSNKEGLAEWEAQRQKWERFGSSWMDKVPNPSGELAQPWIQRKLTLAPPGDKYEKEADRVLSQVFQPINIQKSQIEKLAQEPEEAFDSALMGATIQRQRSTDNRGVSSEFESAINSAKGSGQPLDAGLQLSIGQLMRADLSGVRVHTDAQSDQLNQSIQARAFTTGQDVFFRKGEYQPGRTNGQQLIAHELTHVLQQNAGEVRKAQIPGIQNQLNDESPTKQASNYIVGDGETQEPWQICKSKFLDGLKSAVVKVAEEVLAEIGQSTNDCPYIAYWFDYYASAEAKHIEKAIRRYAPETNDAQNSDELIRLLANRVRQGFKNHVSNGSLEGVPAEIPKNLPNTKPVVDETPGENQIQACFKGRGSRRDHQVTSQGSAPAVTSKVGTPISNLWNMTEDKYVNLPALGPEKVVLKEGAVGSSLENKVIGVSILSTCAAVFFVDQIPNPSQITLYHATGSIIHKHEVKKYDLGGPIIMISSSLASGKATLEELRGYFTKAGISGDKVKVFKALASGYAFAPNGNVGSTEGGVGNMAAEWRKP